MKVDQVFACFNYNDYEKVRMITYEFADYVLVWWNQFCRGMLTHEREMRSRFVATSYVRNLYNKLKKMYQGSKSIYKLCGSPSEEYWKKSKMPNATLCIRETFKDFPPSALPLIDTLLEIDPAERESASDALRSELNGFFQIPNYFVGMFKTLKDSIFHMLQDIQQHIKDVTNLVISESGDRLYS
ncbi:putative serine/threonine-protein kinase, partial [Mucuna pruriens]